MKAVTYKSVVISHLPKSGGSTLADMLAAESGWEKHAIGDLWRARWRQEHPNGIPTFEEYWRSTSREENIQVNLDAAEIARKGNVIIDTRYPVGYDDTVLKIHLTASLDVRASRAKSSYPGLSHRDIRLLLKQREEDEVRVGQDLFGIDYREHRHYSMIFSTDSLRPDDIMDHLRPILRLGAWQDAPTATAK